MDDHKQLRAWARDITGQVSALSQLIVLDRMQKPSVTLYVPVRDETQKLWHALCIELRDRAIESRSDWRHGFRARSYRAEICIGWVRAARLIVEYLTPALTERERKALHAAIPMS